MQYTTPTVGLPQQPVDPRQQMLNEFRTKALRGAQDQAKLTGLDEQYNRFTAQRDAPMAAPTKYGQLGLGAVLSNFVGSGMAKNKLDQIEPQRQAAMTRVNEAKTALPLYNANIGNIDARQNQANFESDAQAKLAAATALAKTKAAQEKLKRDREDQKGTLVTKVSPDGQERTVRYNAQTRTAYLDGQEIPNFSEWTDPAKKTEEVTRGSYGGKALDKKSGEYMDTINRVDDVFSLMTKVTPEQEALINSPMQQAKMAAIKTMTPEKFSALAESQFSGYDDATKAMLISLNSMSSEERNRLFGAALTENELKSSQDFLAATIGKGLPWVRNALETTKKQNVNSLLRVDSQFGGDTYRNMLSNTGTIPEDYTADAFELGNAPAIGSGLENLKDPKEMTLEELQAELAK